MSRAKATGSPLPAYEAHLLSQGRSERTARGYAADVRAFKGWLEARGGDLLSAVRLDVAEYRREAAQKLSPAAVNRRLAALRSFYSWAEKEGLVELNPAGGVKGLPEPARDPRSLGRRELAALFRAVERQPVRGSFPLRERDRAVFSLMAHAGLRLSEVVSLDVSDVVLRERSGAVVVRLGKGMRRREVPLNSTARAALKRWLERRPDAESSALFLSESGGRLSRRSVDDRFRRYARAAGLPEGVTAHCLRHTFCKNLVDAGVSLDRVAVLAGHASLNTTARYTRPTREDLEKAVERVAWE